MDQAGKLQVLVTLPVDDRHRALLEAAVPQAEFLFIKGSDVTGDMAKNAQVIIGNVPAALIRGTEKLAWMQLHSAGTDGYTKGVLPAGAVLTNASGSYGVAISEHMLGMALTLMKRFPQYLRNQQTSLWQDEGPVGGFYGATVLVVGLGDIGLEFAKRCKAMGSRVLGIRRVPRKTPEGVESVHGLEDLNALLPEADVVALCLPSTGATRRLFDADRLACMKRGAVLLNVGRGTAIDQDALCDALESGQIGGAGLDVTDPEPLPADHRLWRMSNLLLTPHVSGGYHFPETLERIVRLSAENLQAFVRGLPLRSIVDFETGYRKV